MRHVFILNPVSGRQDASQAMLPKIEATAAQYGVPVEIQRTEAPQHAVQLAKEQAQKGDAVRLYAVGGDGTLNEVLHGAYQHPNAEVASVPCGSGNDFVRNFGREADFLNLASNMQGSAVPIDLMRTDSGICAAITSTGLDAEVAYNIPKYRRIPLLGGSMAYNISIVEKLLHPLGKTLRVTVDGTVYEGRYLIATVCNGQTYGGGYCAAPNAVLDDGMLEVILVKKVSRLRIAGIIGDYKKGTHFGHDGKIVPKHSDVIFHYRGKNVTIAPTGDEPFILNVDGECGPAKRLMADVLPKAARFVVPKGLLP